MKDLPDVFTQFREKAEKKCPVRKDLPPPAKGDLPLPPATVLSDAAKAALAGGLPDWGALPWPAGAKPEPPKKHPKAVLDFK